MNWLFNLNYLKFKTNHSRNGRVSAIRGRREGQHSEGISSGERQHAILRPRQIRNRRGDLRTLQ
jgi:hypothetical protein